MRCIYRIDINDRYYIGSTVNFKERTRLHLVKLKTQQHPNKFLQNLYNKYGEESFKFSVLELLDESVDTLSREQIYLDEHFGQENCVNLSPISSGGKIYTITQETIQKGLDTKKKTGNYGGNPYPKEAIESNIGAKRTKESCDRMAESKRVHYKNNPKQLEKFKEASSRGRKKRWEQYDKPFILIKNNIEFGPFKTQTEASNSVTLSLLSINRLFLRKLDSVKGYSLKFISPE